MLTTSIRQRVRDNLNRNDAGIDTKIQDWINDTKRRIEQRANLDYMRTVAQTTHTNAAPAAALPTRLKSVIQVKARKTLPTANAGLVWQDLPPLGEHEAAVIESFSDATTVITGDAVGYTLEETTVTVRPKPTVGDTITLLLAIWQFSADWTFGGGEEPYLAKFAWEAIIAGATALGYEMFGEHGDAAYWERKFEAGIAGVVRNETARALSGEIEMRPSTNAREVRPSRWTRYDLINPSLRSE